MMAQARYPSELKIKAVRQVLECGRTITQVANDLGVSKKKIYTWVRTCEKAKDNKLESVFIEPQQEIQSLRKKLKNTEQERDSLKALLESMVARKTN